MGARSRDIVEADLDWSVPWFTRFRMRVFVVSEQPEAQVRLEEDDDREKKFPLPDRIRNDCIVHNFELLLLLLLLLHTS